MAVYNPTDVSTLATQTTLASIKDTDGIKKITDALPTGTNTLGSVKITDGTTVATVRELGTNDAMNVAIVDGLGDQVTSFGAGTQYTEADTDASITGTAMMWEDGSDTLRAVSAAKPLPIGDAGGSLTVDGTFWQATQPVSAAALPLPSGAATETTIAAINTKLTSGTDIGDVTINNASGGSAVNIQDGGNSITVDGAVTATPVTVTTSTLSNVASSATSVTVLALNTARKQAMVFNDSTAILYLKLGATASATSFTARLAPYGYFELPDPVYSGVIDGIWASANGSARVTELTA